MEVDRLELDWDGTKIMVDHKSLSEGRETSFTYCQSVVTLS